MERKDAVPDIGTTVSTVSTVSRPDGREASSSANLGIPHSELSLLLALRDAIKASDVLRCRQLLDAKAMPNTIETVRLSCIPSLYIDLDLKIKFAEICISRYRSFTHGKRTHT